MEGLEEQVQKTLWSVVFFGLANEVRLNREGCHGPEKEYGKCCKVVPI